MEESYEIPLILDRYFLATCGVLIDIKHNELTLTVNDREVKFSIFHDMNPQVSQVLVME